MSMHLISLFGNMAHWRIS